MKTGEIINNNNKLKKFIADRAGIKTSDVTEQMMKEAQEALELGMVMMARDTVFSGLDEQSIYDELVRQYNNMPVLDARSSTSMENQAYSTPAPMAFIASQLAGITQQSTAYDPTTGNGMLLIGTSVDNGTTNEINDDRVSNLKQLGYQPTQHDALTFVPNQKFDAVITNPPFGKLKNAIKIDGFNLKKLDYVIPAKALESMKDDGRAVIIIGANDVRNPGIIGESDRIFFNWLYSHYNVVDHFEADGSLYKRQGAGWPVRIITIDGRKQSNNLSPRSGTIKRLDNWNDIYEHYQSVMDTLRQSQQERESLSERENETGSSEPTDSGGSFMDKITRTDRSRRSGSRRNSNTGSTVDRAGSDRDTDSGHTGQSAKQPAGNNATEQDQLPKSRNSGQRHNKTEQGAESDRRSGNTGQSTLNSSEFQDNYDSASEANNHAVLTPKTMASSIKRALKKMVDEIGNVDRYVMEKLGYDSIDDVLDAFMGLQIDSIAAAIYNHEKRNKGIIIADQTGVGKGRQAAGIIRYAERIGKIPIFVTVKPNLFTDMYNDLKDINTHHIRPFILNRDAAIKQMDENDNPLPDLFANKQSRTVDGIKIDEHNDIIREIIETGKLPADRNALFLTYSQVKDNNIQRRLIESLADKAFFVLDESHNAAGDFQARVKGGGKRKTTAGFFADVLQNASVTYLSATYAKRPDNMAIYFKTDLMDAVDNFSELIDAVETGGLPLQTVISAMLAESGQLFRRERSFAGIEIKTEVNYADGEAHRQLFDKITEGLRAVVDADLTFKEYFVEWARENTEDLGMRIRAAGNMAAASVDHHNFTSIVHNYISQILMAMKSDGVIEKSLQLVQEGKKPVIATDNTMESFINNMIEKHNLKPGDPFPFDYRDILLAALERTRRISLKDTTGNSEPVQVELNELDGISRQAYENAEQIIRSLDLSGLPVSPIDYIKQKLLDNGIETGEITGRKTIIDYSGDVPRIAKRPSNEKKQRRTTVDNFNSGKLTAIFLNQAGSTGLSIHASEKFSNQDPRHMLVMQASLDINTVMQMLGRINRTGQVATPEFTLMALDLPAEKRPFAILAQKLLSLNAQTSANSDSDVSIKAPNILNKYGDIIVNNYLIENSSLASRLNISVVTDEDKGPPQGIAKTFTGRLSLLSVEQQEEALSAVESDYLALIDYLDKTGQNDLNPKTVDLDAKILESEIIYRGKENASFFGGDTTMHKVDVRYQGKPPTANDVKKAINKSLDGQSVQEFTNQLIAKKKKDQEIYNNDLVELFRKHKQQIQNEFKKDKLLNISDPGNLNISHFKQLSNVVEFLKHSNDFGETHRTTKKYDELLRKLINFESVLYDQNNLKEKTEELLSNQFVIGNHFELNIAGEKMIGVVTRVQDAHVTGKGNPLAESKTRITFMVNNGIRQITLPLSQINNTPGLIEKKLPTTGTEILDTMFDITQNNDRREDRYIATGNLISGISQLHKDGGRIISFTGNDGKTYQGILMPKRYRSDTSTTKLTPVTLRDPAKIVKFLRDNRDNHLIRGYGLRNKNNKIALSSNGNNWVLQLPKSNRDATVNLVKFDDDLRTIMGRDFFSKGKNMFARFDDSNLPAVVERLLQITNLSALASMTPQLEAAGFNVNQQAVKSFDGTDNDVNVDTSYTKPVETPIDTPQDVITFAGDGGKNTTFTTMDSMHSQKKEPLFVVNMQGNLNKDEYTTVNTMAKTNNGYYIKAGLRRYYTPLPGTTATGTPTFTFPTKADRDNFLATLQERAQPQELETIKAIEGYSDQHPDWATTFEKDTVGGKIIYSENDWALIEGYSLLTGTPVYPFISREHGKSRVDITSFTGDLLNTETRQRLEAARQRHIDKEQALFKENQHGPFTNNQRVVAGENISEDILNAAKSWLAMVGIKDRVFISDIFANPSKAAEKYHLYGDYAAIRHASDPGSSEGGYIRTLPNGDHFIMLKAEGQSNEKLLATLAHEIGHIIEKTAYKNASQDTQNAIIDAFNEWIREHKPNIQQPGSAKALIESMRHPFTAEVTGITETTKAADLNTQYWASFSEWFADNTARWSLTSKKPKSVVEKFFKSVAEKLRTLYSALTGKRYQPNKVLADYLESLTPPDFTVEMAMESQRELEANQRYRLAKNNAKGIKSYQAKTVQAQLNRTIGKIVTVVQSEKDLPKSLLDQIRIDNVSGQIKGIYDDATGTTYLIADHVNDIDDALRTALHEAVGHKGIRNVLGSALNRTLDQIYNSLSPEQQRQLRAAYARQIENLSTTDQQRLIAEEYLANLAEKNPDHNWLKTTLTRLKAWLRKYLPSLKWSQNDMTQLIIDARQSLATPAINTRNATIKQGYVPKSGPNAVRYQLNKLISNDNQIINELKKTGKHSAHSIGEFAKKNGLGFLSGKQIAEIYSPIFKSVENTVGYNPLKMLDKLLQKMTSDRSNWAHRAEKIDQRWSKLARKSPDNYNRLSNLMHKSTLYQIDPRQPVFKTKSGLTFDSLRKIINDATSDKQRIKFERELAEETKRLKHYNEVRPMWLALNSEPEAQRLYNDVEKYYLNQYKSLQEALQERIDSMDLDPESRKGIRHQLNAMFQKALAGPYFPLMRFGDYVITAKDKDGNHYRAHYETATAREAAETQLEKDGYTITFTGMRDQFDPRNLAGVPEFSAKIRKLLGVSKIKDIENNPEAMELLSQINQITLELLPEMSSAKRGMRRAGIPGYHENARRAFDATSLSQANRIGKVRYGWQMENELNQIKNIANQENTKSPLTARQRDTAKHVYNEMSKRHDLIMNPNGSPIAASLTNLGFIWYMGASAGAGIINLTQNLLIALPQLGAQYGFIKTAKIMKDVFVDYMAGYSKPTSLDDALQNSWFSLENSTIPADEKALIQELINDGTIETTQAHVLAQMADTDIRPENVKRRDWQTKITRVSGIFFHNAEVANRQIAALTAYRLAKANKKITLINGKPDETTIDKIRQAVFDAHFDYSATNRPRYFKSNWAKVLLLFKQFSQNTAFLLSRNFYQAIKGESKEVKQQARKTLLGIMAMQLLFAGTLGLPLASSILTMAGMALGDEDDPVDAEVTVRQYFSDLFGKELGHALSKGVFNSFLNLDLHSRTSLSDLFFRGASYDMSPRQEAQYAISNTLAGPIGSMTVNVWAGLNEVVSGDPWRGLETMAPKFIRDAMRSYRYSSEGVQNRQGQTIIEEFNVTEKLAQFAGISPARLNEAYDASNAVSGLREKIQYRRSRLLDTLDKAKTIEQQRDARQQIQAFNDVQRERERYWAIINTNTIKRSLTGKEKRRQQSKYGIYLSDAQFGMMDMARFADL